MKDVTLFTHDFCVAYQEGVQIPPREKQDKLNAYMWTHGYFCVDLLFLESREEDMVNRYMGPLHT